MQLRRFPVVHRPLRWLNRSALPTLRSALVTILRYTLPFRNFGPARGSFSDYELVQAGKLEGRIIAERQEDPVLPGESIILKCGRRQHLQQPWPIFWAHHQNARLLGASLAHVNERGEISEDAAYGRVRFRTDSAWHYPGLKKPTPLKGAWTSVIGQWLQTEGRSPYAHWLLDALPRLALLREFPANTGILVPSQLYPSQVESLKLLGVWDRCRQTTERHLLVEDYYFSSPPSMIVCHSPYAVNFLRSAFLPKVAERGEGGGTPKRFFIRRTSVGRNMTNEAEVLEYFRRLGWTIVDTAALSFVEQVRWFAQAEAICAIHGSGTANMVWCSAGCKFIELFAADYLAGDQEWIAQCVQVDYHFMIFPCDYKLDANVDLAALREKLAKLDLL
jgi:hypothetical protein